MTCSEECMMHANLHQYSEMLPVTPVVAEKRNPENKKGPLCGPFRDYFWHLIY